MGSATGWLRQQYRIHAALEPPKNKDAFKLKTELESKARKCKVPSKEEEIAHAATIFWSRFEDVCGSEFLGMESVFVVVLRLLFF